MKKCLLIILFVLLFPFVLWGKSPTFAPSRTITLLFSSNIHGEVEPCG